MPGKAKRRAMISFLRLWAAAPAVLLALSSAPALCAAEPRVTLFCLSDGMKIGASRFETRDGKFLIYVEGSSTPLEYPMSAVRGVNVDPCPAPTAALQPATKAAIPAPPSGSARFGVQGSNTIGERLMPMLVEAYAHKLGASPTAKLTANEEQEISFDANGAHTSIDLRAHGSGTAAKALVEGAAQIGMASRRLTNEEVRLISEKFKIDALAQGAEHVLALDGLGVVVNPANPVRTLSLEQIARIFAGEITNWADAGGANRPINILRRDDKSGTYDTFKNLVLAPFKRAVSPRARAFESSEALSDEVSRDTDAIGFVALPYVNKNVAVSIGSACGLIGKASKFSIKTEDYPLARRLYLYTIGDPVDPAARELLRFALSDEAQPVIEEAEFIEQAVGFQAEDEQKRWAETFASSPRLGLPAGKTPPAGAVSAFKRLTAATRRSSVALRFKEGSAQLDNRSLQDIERLSRCLKSPELAGRRFYVVGFADADGDWNNNDRLALQRAKVVASQLARVGLPAPADAVKSFSFFAPSACNDAGAGSAKNRRVEIWVQK